MPDDDPNVTTTLCSECFDDVHCDGAVDWCDCTCTWDEDWADG